MGSLRAGEFLGGKCEEGFPSLRIIIGEAARQKIEADLTWDAVAKNYFEMFEKAILKK
jgi:glycosyltransferase involved in cell wall biosynthesis